MNQMSVEDEAHLIGIKTVLAMVPISRPTIYRLMQKDEFPKPVEIGAGRFWVESEILEWKREKIRSRNA